jgi:hypothetical protein
VSGLVGLLERWTIMRRGFREDVDFSRRELASRNLLLEQEIELGESAASGLRHSVVGVNDAEAANTSPEETSIVTPIPSSGVQHVRREHRAHYADDIVEVAA